MNIHKILRSQLLKKGVIRTDYLVSGQITLEVLETLSHNTYSITGCQYLSPKYLIQKPGDIQITGILHSNVIQVTHPEHSANYMEEYLSGLFSLVPEKKNSVSLIQTMYEDMRAIILSKMRRKKPAEPEMNETTQLFID